MARLRTLVSGDISGEPGSVVYAESISPTMIMNTLLCLV